METFADIVGATGMSVNWATFEDEDAVRLDRMETRVFRAGGEVVFVE
jgi:hypothetical protein